MVLRHCFVPLAKRIGGENKNTHIIIKAINVQPACRVPCYKTVQEKGKVGNPMPSGRMKGK